MNSENTRTVIFTDLDGTILNEKYECKAVKPTISRLSASGVPIVLCSSKTRAEIEFYRKKLGIADPFIAENGAAIFVPTNCFRFTYAYTKQTADYRVIELAVPYSVVRRKLEKVRLQTLSKVIGFGDMTAEEVAKEAELPMRLAELAKKREYDEPFRIVVGNERAICTALKSEGLSTFQGNRYYHVLGGSDKGKAAGILKKLYRQKFGKITTIGIGDSPNDFPMLEVMDKRVLLKTNGKNTSRTAWRQILSNLLAIS